MSHCTCEVPTPKASMRAGKRTETTVSRNRPRKARTAVAKMEPARAGLTVSASRGSGRTKTSCAPGTSLAGREEAWDTRGTFQ